MTTTSPVSGPVPPAPSPESTQAGVSAEMAAIAQQWQQTGSCEETQPRLDYAPYRSSLLRHPTKDLHHVDPESVELYAPVFGHHDVQHLLDDDG